MTHVKVFNQGLDALIDTGASISAISKDMLIKIARERKIRTTESTVKAIIAANGQEMAPLAMVTLPVQINQW